MTATVRIPFQSPYVNHSFPKHLQYYRQSVIM
jgi:hypothetical protein